MCIRSINSIIELKDLIDDGARKVFWALPAYVNRPLARIIISVTYKV